MYYLNIFFFYSIVGHILESFLLKNYVSGVLFLPWTPVYGIGILTAHYIYKYLNNKFSKWLEIILHFILCLIILSILEYIGGNLIEFIFNKIYWNYDPLKYNLGRYISLESAFIWGLGSTIVIYLINPIMEKVFKKIPKTITYILMIILAIDTIITFIVKVPL